MLRKNSIITGTLILTLTGVISRIIGFFYRIFLSRCIGEEGMGIYQLLSQVMAISFSLTCAGIQTSISKYTAYYMAKNDRQSSRRILVTGFGLSLSLSILTTCFLYRNAARIASVLLLESRCEPLVRIYALSLPFACIHSCINGYYYGLKKSLIPSATQLIEQLARVGSVFAIYTYSFRIHTEPTIAVTMLGILIGEICSTLVSLVAIYLHFIHNSEANSFSGSSPDNFLVSGFHTSSQFISRTGKRTRIRNSFSAIAAYKKHLSEMLRMALPLIANRLTLNLLQSVEAVYIPNRLVAYGLTQTQALANYGVLTGMTYPLILFPCAVTSSVSVLLLPYISEASARHDTQKIRAAIKKCVLFCILLGSGFCLLFLLSGPFLGRLLFDSELAGAYIQTLSISCPLLYLTGILTSILHGLGKALEAFLYNAISLLIRLFFVFALIPQIGMTGYLVGILVSELCLGIMMLTALKRHLLQIQ